MTVLKSNECSLLRYFHFLSCNDHIDILENNFDFSIKIKDRVLLGI